MLPTAGPRVRCRGLSVEACRRVDGVGRDGNRWRVFGNVLPQTNEKGE